jgi:TonB family protein
MKRTTAALIIAILFHIVLALLFVLLGSISPKMEKKEPPKENRIKISLKERPKVKKNAAVKNKIKKPEIAPPMPKGKQLKKIVKPEKMISVKPKKPIKPQKKIPAPKKINKNKPPIKPVTKPMPPKKPYIPLKKKPKKAVDQNLSKSVEKKKSSIMEMIAKKEPAKKYEPEKVQPEKKINIPKESSKLFNMLSKKVATEETEQEHKRVTERTSRINQDIKELYGDEFGKLTEGEQKYIIDNQEIMRRITQQVLNRVGRVNIPSDMRINSENVIEFYLHPNGDISDIKLIKQSGFYILDDTTKETIEYAYSRYPRPKQKTLIRYKVGYYLRGY